ncbi:MAG TPA: hypothetical protein VGO11_27285 [Chthoniobacteraceae bacterium]|nr:hypothetical protein [Chthoniobacteraceae bacterium]
MFCLLLACGVAEEKTDSPIPPATTAGSDGTAEYVKGREKAQRAFWVERMEDEKKWLTQTLALSPEQAAALAPFAEAAVKKALAEWAAATAQMVEDFQQDKDLADDPPLVVLMGGWNAAVANRVFGQYRTPTDQPAWRDGLARVLTPAQTEAWQKQAPAHLAALLKPFLKQAKELEEDYRDSAGAELEKENIILSNTYDLREGQEKKVGALATRLVKRRLTEWRSEAARCLADQPPEAPDAVASDDLCVPEPRPVTAYDPGWLEGLGKILDASTWKSLTKVLKEREARRPQVLAQMLVHLVDDEVRCTARQREQLLPLAERWVQAKPDLFQEQYREELKSLHFLAAASRATKEELAGLLEDSQIRTWRRVCVPGIVDEMGTLVLRPPRDQAKAPPPPAPAPAGRNPESVVQAYLLRTESRVRARCLARAVGCAQEIGRVCALPEEARTLLQTAARGAVETSLREWRFNAERTVRDQVEDFLEENPETLQTQLEQIDGSTAMNEVSTPPDKQPIWARTLKKVMGGLPPEQAKAWQQEESARAEFKRDAIVRFMLEDFNRVIYLTAEQMPQVQALLAQAVKARAEELELRRFTNESPWYLSTPQNLSPFNYIPEKSLRPLLTAAQWAGWSKSDAYAEPEAKP